MSSMPPHRHFDRLQILQEWALMIEMRGSNQRLTSLSELKVLNCLEWGNREVSVFRQS